MSARIGEHEDRTRLVIELSDPVNLRAFALANPDRVVIDMPEVSWRLGAPPRPTGFGAVKSYRYGLFRAGNSRMVIDLNQPVTVSDALVLPPSAGFGYRVVIDLFPTTRAKFDCPGRLAGRPEEARKRCRKAGRPDRRPAGAAAGRRQEGHRAGSGPWRPRFRHHRRQRADGKGPGAGRRAEAARGCCRRAVTASS